MTEDLDARTVAIVLAGGLGTRLREETEFRPKPMVDIGGHPAMWHIMKGLAHHGITDFIVCVGYKAEVIKDYFLNYEARNNDFTIHLGQQHTVDFHGNHTEVDWDVTVVDTGHLTPTGGRIHRVRNHAEKYRRSIVVYGDGIANVDIAALLAHHEEQRTAATLTIVRPPSRFGLVTVDEKTRRVTGFREKPLLDDWINVGFFVFEHRVFDYLEPDSVLERKPLERLAADGELTAFAHDGFWQPMDTYREATLLNELWDSEDAPWKVWSD
ncbi:MAG: glucose-1-phosphate cytidylyltransferase [Acidimicrobiia bacterium]